MKITIYTADCCGNKQNKTYPNKAVITDAADMKKMVRFDHVCALYKDNIRANDNFILSDCIPMDCDNDHSETDWITAEMLDEVLSDVAYVLVYSKSHMKEKDGKSARPRFHVYFPCSDYHDANAYKTVKKRIHAEFPFFDGNALDAARFLFGSNGDVIWHEGSLSIEDYLLLMKQQKSQTKRMKASPFLLERCSNHFVTFKVT